MTIRVPKVATGIPSMFCAVILAYVPMTKWAPSAGRFARLRGKPVSSVLLAIGMALATAGAAQAATTPAKQAITWQPAKLVSGSPVLIKVSAARAQAISADWLGHRLNFFRQGGDSWYALAGVPVETKAGSYLLDVTETMPSGERKASRRIKISTAHYPKITAHVARKFTEPTTEQMKQISADKGVKETVLATASVERLWKGDFHAPVDSPVSDIFGTERVFNGAVQSRHLGLDFAAPAGTEVHAINSGTVVLAQPLYFEGGFVVIDHGQGLLSLYLHLSEFRVKQGEQVSSGQAIGLSGSSGRATGPHLHLAVRWQGVYVDPQALLHLRIP